jgi:hypothetical protein
VATVSALLLLLQTEGSSGIPEGIRSPLAKLLALLLRLAMPRAAANAVVVANWRREEGGEGITLADERAA